MAEPQLRIPVDMAATIFSASQPASSQPLAISADINILCNKIVGGSRQRQENVVCVSEKSGYKETIDNCSPAKRQTKSSSVRIQHSHYVRRLLF